jgi:hypothetical protein
MVNKETQPVPFLGRVVYFVKASKMGWKDAGDK